MLSMTPIDSDIAVQCVENQYKHLIFANKLNNSRLKPVWL